MFDQAALARAAIPRTMVRQHGHLDRYGRRVDRRIVLAQAQRGEVVQSIVKPGGVADPGQFESLRLARQAQATVA